MLDHFKELALKALFIFIDILIIYLIKRKPTKD
jgi:hypothetical protein